MHRVSTNWTLFLKFFIPVFWIVFFGAVTIAVLLYQFEYIGDIPAVNFRIGMVLFFVSGLLLMLFTLMRLKRVELSTESVFVTDYFKSRKYTYDSIEEISISRFLFFATANIRLHQKGTFGKNMVFVPNLELFRYFLTQHPEVFSKVRIEGLK